MNPGSFVSRHHQKLFFGCWLLLNLIQSSLSGLLDDESYYWVYSKFLDWGYFDHPPMIALLIKVGYFIFPNELGVRLLVAIMSTVTLWLIQKLLNKQDDRLFYSIAISIGLLQLGGILAVPDVPLLFFTTIFFLAYRKFVQRSTLANGVLVGVCIALLLYSKYHGVLVILFTIISNPRLLLKPQSYVAVGIALLLFAPHLYWQLEHGFPSIQYHLKERVQSDYTVSSTFEYLLVQLLFVGPLSSVVLLWATFRKKPADELERALKFSTAGFFLFFLLYTFRGNVEANWTFPAFIGIIVLSHQYLVVRQHLRRLVNALAIITLFIVCACRLYMAGLLPMINLNRDEYLFNKEWASEIHENSKGLPVFFIDSYQRASKYWFYTGIPSFSLNTLDYRRNAYNYWPIEDTLFHKRMYGIYQGKHEDYFTDSIDTKKGIFLGRIFEDYFSFSRILIHSREDISGNKDEIVSLHLEFSADMNLLQHIHPSFDTAQVWMAAYKLNIDEPQILPTDLTLNKLKYPHQQLNARVRLQLEKGNYHIRFGISSCISNWPTINSSVYALEVK